MQQNIRAKALESIISGLDELIGDRLGESSAPEAPVPESSIPEPGAPDRMEEQTDDVLSSLGVEEEVIPEEGMGQPEQMEEVEVPEEEPVIESPMMKRRMFGK